MAKLHSVEINVSGIRKEIAVYCDDVTSFEYPIDILTTSAAVGSYEPVFRTVFHALDSCGISVRTLARYPLIDLRDPCHVWLSEEIAGSRASIGRIGCIEFSKYRLAGMDTAEADQSVVNSLRSYFYMLDIAALYGVRMNTVALPLLGSGSQSISGDLMLLPMINECVSFLSRNTAVERVFFIERNPEKAVKIANCLQQSLRFQVSAPEPVREKKELVFLSYSSKDKNIADNLCAKLEQKGIKVWYAPRDVQGPYAAAIYAAIEKASYFAVILSENSVASQHVLNEIDLAVQNLSRGLKIKPLRIDANTLTPSIKYYLSRQHWLDATVPPLEKRLNEFVEDLLADRSN